MRAAIRFVLRQGRARPLACFAVAFLLGLSLRLKCPVPTLYCAAALLCTAVAAWLLRKRRRAVACMLLLAGLLCGMTRMGAALDAISPVETRYSVQMTGRVASEPFTNPDTGRRICRFEIEDAQAGASGLCVRLYLRGEPEPLEAIAYGQRLSLVGHIWAPDPVTNPSEFDFGAYLNRQGMDAYATARIEDVTILSVQRDIRSPIIDARHAIARRIDALFPENAGMMRALVLGDRSLLGDEQRQAMSRSGTAHLISISGLHVTVLAALLAMLLKKLMPDRYANLVAIALLIPYGAMVGFGAPFVRALVMFAILCFAPIAGFPSDPATRLCAAMLGWLLVHPLSVGDAGFALSFSASAGILLLMPTLMEAFGVEALRTRKPSPLLSRRLLHRVLLYFPTLLCASLAAQLASLPYVVTFFGVQSVLSVPFNLVCVPLCLASYVLGLIVLASSVVSMPLALLLARVPDALFTALVSVTRFSMAVPSASVRIGRYPFALIAIHWAIIVASSRLSRLKFRWRRLLPAGLVGVAALSSALVFMISWPFSVVFLDADQADCAVVRSRGHTFLFDVGDTYTPAADFLNATCLHLDGVVLSHPHEDHAGGLASVLYSFRPDVVYVPAGWFDVEETALSIQEGIDAARAMGVEIRELSAGDSLQLPGRMQQDVYSPVDGIEPASVNDMSMLALLSCDAQQVLFTGDLSSAGEPERIPDADVLKVAHHGSDKATSERFLAACTPQIAVISVGENNYGHPGETTLEKLADIGAQVYQTRDCGAITLTWRKDAWRVDTFLEVTHEVE